MTAVAVQRATERPVLVRHSGVVVVITAGAEAQTTFVDRLMVVVQTLEHADNLLAMSSWQGSKYW
jgi:hypothetical protein